MSKFSNKNFDRNNSSKEITEQNEEVKVEQATTGAAAEVAQTDNAGAEVSQAQQAQETIVTQEPVVDNAAPAVVQKEIKVGTVVNANEAAAGKEAPSFVKESISRESTAKPIDTSTPFEQKIAAIMAGDNKRERYVVTFMQEYLKHMSPGVANDTETGVRMQLLLWRTIKNVVENDDGFREAFRLLIAYFKEYRNGAFHETYVHRFHPDLTMQPGEITGFTRMVNLLTVAAGLTNKNDIRKFVNLSASFDTALSDSARNRVMNYFDN